MLHLPSKEVSQKLTKTETVSLGIEMGVRMKGKAKPVTKTQKRATYHGNRTKDLRAAILAFMNKRKPGTVFRLIEIRKAVAKQLSGLSSENTRGVTLWTTINRINEIEKVPNSKGEYRLKDRPGAKTSNGHKASNGQNGKAVRLRQASAAN